MKLFKAWKTKGDELMRSDMRKLRQRFVIAFIQVVVLVIVALAIWPQYSFVILIVGTVLLAIVFYGIEVTRSIEGEE